MNKEYILYSTLIFSGFHASVGPTIKASEEAKTMIKTVDEGVAFFRDALRVFGDKVHDLAEKYDARHGKEKWKPSVAYDDEEWKWFLDTLRRLQAMKDLLNLSPEEAHVICTQAGVSIDLDACSI